MHADELLAALDVKESSVPVEAYHNGPRHVFVGLASAGALSALRPDHVASRGFRRAANCYAGWRARMSSPAYGVVEAAATGSAAGPLAIRLARHRLAEYGQEHEILPGVEMGETLTSDVESDFSEYQAPPSEPITLIARWLARTDELGVREPLALATADAQGRPSTRIIALTSIADEGLVFAGHSTSRKGREMAVNPWASGVLYWRETGQQIIVSRPVAMLTNAESSRCTSCRWSAI